MPIRRTIPICAFLFLLMAVRPGSLHAQSGDNAFGDSIPISNGLLGKVYLLPETSDSLPNFDTLKALPDLLYAKEINVPDRQWSAGFPGLRSRYEWFGIEYTTLFQVSMGGIYNFHLSSDDGSKMWIDDSLIIDYDGIHAAGTRSDSVYLKPGVHSFRLDYFQGPRYSLALQLTYNADTAKEQFFPGKMFILKTPKPPFNFWPWLIALVLIIGIIVYYQKKKKSSQSVSPDQKV